jgi:hypothetical protein
MDDRGTVARFPAGVRGIYLRQIAQTGSEGKNFLGDKAAET